MLEIKDLCEKLRPIYGDMIDNYESMYVVSDRNGREEIKQWLEILYHKTFKNGKTEEAILVTPPKQPLLDCYGPFTLGSVIYNDKVVGVFGMRESEFLSHMLIVGRSGSGKTNVVFQIIKELLTYKKPFWVFDWKRNYRDLLQLTRDLHIFTIGRNISSFTFNPLIPLLNEDPKTRIKHFTKWVCKAYYLGEGAASIIEKGLDFLFDKFSVYEGKQLTYPTLKDLEAWLQNFKPDRREKDWLQSTTRAIRSLNFGIVGECLNTQAQLPLAELLGKNVIFELDALNRNEKIFFKEALLYARHAFKIAQPEREKLQDIIIIEEAHHLLSKHQENEDDILDIILREERELGTGIIIVDQQASDLSRTAFANTATTIALNQKSSSDINAISSSLLLAEDQKRALGRLPIGYAIVKMQHRKEYDTPLLIECKHVQINKGQVTDEQVKQHMKGIETREFEEAKRLQREARNYFESDPNYWLMRKYSDALLRQHYNDEEIRQLQEQTREITHDIETHIEATGRTPAWKAESSNTAGPATIDEENLKEVRNDTCSGKFGVIRAGITKSREIRDVPKSPKEEPLDSGKCGKQPLNNQLLRDIYNHPYSGVVARYKRLGITRHGGDKIKQQLLQQQLITQEEIPQENGRLVLLKLTPKGYELLQAKPTYTAKNGSLEHRYWRETIADYYRRKHNLKASIEAELENGHRCDVLLENEKTKKRIPVEIETGKSKHTVENIKKDLEGDFEHVVILATNDDAYKKIKEQLAREGMDKDKRIKLAMASNKHGDLNETIKR